MITTSDRFDLLSPQICLTNFQEVDTKSYKPLKGNLINYIRLMGTFQHRKDDGVLWRYPNQ